MNKLELVDVVAEKTEVSKKEVEKVLGAVLETIREEVAKGEKVQFVGFGTFESRHRNARTGKNPATKEAIKIPASDVPAFKAGKLFKEMVNSKSKAKGKGKAKSKK